MADDLTKFGGTKAGFEQLHRDAISDGLRMTGFGSIQSSTHNLLRGLSPVPGGMSPVPINRDKMGYVFWTRPIMNLAYDNVNIHRRMEFLASEDPRSVGCYIKSLLSPRYVDASIPQDPRSTNIRSAFIDEQQAFIPIMSRTLVSLTGWPDRTLDTKTSNEGYAKSSYSFVDDRADMYGTFDLTATFRRIDGDIMTAMAAVWHDYMANVADGSCNPYMQMIIDDEIDYMTRPYRLIMDANDQYVTKIAAPAAAFPIATELGALFNYDYTKDTVDNYEISIPFRCIQVHYLDSALVKDFNKTVVLFNARMADGVRESQMVKLKRAERAAYTGYIYPRIEDDMELTWWTTAEHYNIFKEEAKREP